MRRTFLILMSVFTVAGLTPSCSDEAAESGAKAKKKDKGSEEKEADDDDDDAKDKKSTNGAKASTGQSTPADCAAASGTGATAATGSSGAAASTGASAATGAAASTGDAAGLALAEGPAYDTISTIIDTKCVSCHVKGSPNGNFKTIDGVKALADEILVRMSLPTGDGRFMPPGGDAFTPAELKRVDDWIKGGKQGAGQPVGGDSPTDSSTTASSGCGSSSASGGTTASSTTTGDGGTTTGGEGDGSDTTSDGGATTPPDESSGTGDEAIDGLLNPPQRSVCHASNKPYDRNLNDDKGGCAEGVTLVKAFACTKEGILGAFPANIQEALKVQVFDKMEAAGKKLDDCGMGPNPKTNEPALLLYFFCLSDIAGIEPAACKDPATLVGKTIHVKTSRAPLPVP